MVYATLGPLHMYTCALDGYILRVLAVVGGVDGQLGAGEEVGLVSTALHIVQQNGQGGGAVLSWIHRGSKPWSAQNSTQTYTVMYTHVYRQAY